MAGIELPARPPRPRRIGRTALIDHGPDADGWMGLRGAADLLEAAAEFIDAAKIFAVNAALLPMEWIRQKIALYRQYGVDVYPGGILFEVCWLRRQLDAYYRLVKDLGFTTIEISENYLEASSSLRRTWIRRAVDEGLSVIYEYGNKHPSGPLSANALIEATHDLLAAGAEIVVVEQSEIDQLRGGREDVLVETVQTVGMEHLLFEAAPSDFPAYHTWLIETLGPEVNLGNITPGQVLKLEGFRRGIGRPVGYRWVAELAAAAGAGRRPRRDA